MIQAIAFDLGRVLVTWDKTGVPAAFAEHSSKTETEIKEIFSTWDLGRKHDLGEMSSNDFYKAAKDILGLRPEVEYNDFVSVWTNIFSENDGICELLERIKPGVQKIIVSNTDPIHWGTLKNRPEIRDYFNEQKNVLSFEVGALKPDVKMWQTALQKLNLTRNDAGTVLYIDDVLDYVSMAESLGFKAAQYDSSYQKTSDLEKILQTYTLLV